VPVTARPEEFHTWGAPMNGTLVELVRRLGTSGWTAFTPGNPLSCSSLAASTSTATPL